MPTITVTLWGKYKYLVTVPENPTLHQLAWAISLEIHNQERKTKFTDRPRTYNYVMECLLRKTAYNFRFNAENPTPDTRKELYAAASELTYKTKPIKVKCDNCNGKGEVEAEDQTEYESIYKCPKCNGHGFLIEKQMYRVGDTFSNMLVIDIDNHDLENLKDVAQFYEGVLKLNFSTPKFKHGAIKTRGGYWLIGDKEYNSVDDFVFAHCQVLYPCLQPNEFKGFVKGVLALDKTEGNEFIPATSEDIKKSKFYKGYGNFDVVFAFLSIKRERSTIRESKKYKDDKIEEIEL